MSSLSVSSAFVVALTSLFATISRLLIFVFSSFIDPLSFSLPFCVFFKALGVLQLAFKVMRKYSSAGFLPCAFHNVCSLLCFNILFLSIFIVYIFAFLPFLTSVFFAFFS